MITYQNNIKNNDIFVLVSIEFLMADIVDLRERRDIFFFRIREVRDDIILL
jgi:hypothetical protein